MSSLKSVKINIPWSKFVLFFLKLFGFLKTQEKDKRLDLKKN